MASSSALVWSDWVCPRAAAIASKQVRPTLLKGSCSVSDHPDVCECVRKAIDLGFSAPKLFTIFAHSRRPARNLAISMKWFIPIPQKNDNRGANLSTGMPASMPARRYSIPSASVYASSISAVAPASCIWYPEMEIELNLGIFCEVNSKMSAIIFMENSGG